MKKRMVCRWFLAALAAWTPPACLFSALLLAAALAATSARADSETVGGYTWTYRIIDDSVAEIYGPGWQASVSPKPKGSIAIPSTLGGKPVGRLGALAFLDCFELTNVTIPDSVTSIGDRTFFACSQLPGVDIPNGVTNIGYQAFMGCFNLKTITIPGTVEHIGVNTFEQCQSLTNATIGCGVPIISDYMFKECTNLVSMAIPDSVTNIGMYAFYRCSRLQQAILGNGVVNIGTNAFATYSLSEGPFATFIYVSDIYNGAEIPSYCKRIGLSISHPGEQILSAPTTITASCAFKDAVLRYTTDGTMPTPESPVFTPLEVRFSTTVTIGAFFNGERVLTTRGIYHLPSAEFVSLGDKGTVEKQTNGYFATANDGVTIEESDFIFLLPAEAYEIDIAADAKTATVRLKKPEFGGADGDVEAVPDPLDPLKLLVIVPEEHMKAIPAAGTGEVVRALPVKSCPGLWYRAAWADAIDGPISSGEKVQAMGTELYLGVIRQDGGKGFYGATVSEE